MYVFVYVCMYVCMYVCKWIYGFARDQCSTMDYNDVFCGNEELVV